MHRPTVYGSLFVVNKGEQKTFTWCPVNSLLEKSSIIQKEGELPWFYTIQNKHGELVPSTEQEVQVLLTSPNQQFNNSSILIR